MKNDVIKINRLQDESTVYYLSFNSSRQSCFFETTEEKEQASTTDDNVLAENNIFSIGIHETNNFEMLSESIPYDPRVLDYIAKTERFARNRLISQYTSEISNMIFQDEYFDGEMSQSERYILEAYEQDQLDIVADALMNIYESNFDNVHILEGILTMISCVPYDAIDPKGQIMAMGLLSHNVLAVRDKAIQCFERWNSKKGLRFLNNIKCTPAWLQNYVDKVIMYIERDGTK